MGIKQLSKLIKEKCKKAIVSRKMGYYSSTKIAIDASLCLYQFLIAVRTDGANLGYEDATTSHLVGMFYRTIRIIESGIIPVYVFDGKAPPIKAIELQKRNERRLKAEKMLEQAKLEEDKKEMDKHEKRKVKVEESHVDDCKRLFRLMGVPFVTAESESEAYCSLLCKRGVVKAVATEDMDALCFGAPILLRNMNASQSKNLDIDEYNLGTILKELELTMGSFIDLCILMGCDYCDTIKGVGHKRAYDLIKKYGCIESIIESETPEVPDNFDYKAARLIFNELSSVGEAENFEIMYDQLDKEGLVQFLVKEKGFDEVRVTNGIEKIIKSSKRGNQTKLDAFFKKT
ncbi:uncharacterized protein VICG_00772 [Vittaforma corneae ATCC 50505]|uniref:Flap endonuclease 1 n=1 Tax=Vittaforma corneae (strain ATCC 50505) TaxID=993615 RepID=L2GMT8_VITCO|nr:uncharacterized protein VICG_00772 [Vittaforma corneae ATCC 50505]ELA42131.1 hypothetical protein VICG_00772 [Vittaforma corneae ATCC 50505]